MYLSMFAKRPVNTQPLPAVLQGAWVHLADVIVVCIVVCTQAAFLFSGRHRMLRSAGQHRACPGRQGLNFLR